MKYAALAGGSLYLGMGEISMAMEKSRVSLVRTENRKSGVSESIKALHINPVKNKDVLIKPNFNTADLVPGSTHNDTLVSLIEEVWSMGAKSVSLGERSYPPTKEVMDQKGIIPLMEKLNVRIIDFDDLQDNDWVHVRAKDSHWQDGFRVARPILESECLISTCCLKTHQYGGIFTMSLKLHVGVVRQQQRHPPLGSPFFLRSVLMNFPHSSRPLHRAGLEVEQVAEPSHRRVEHLVEVERRGERTAHLQEPRQLGRGHPRNGAHRAHPSAGAG
mgnify:CR=1 FL=1